MAREVHQNSRGGAPDIPSLVVEHVVTDVLPFELARTYFMVARVQHEGERHLEHGFDLERIDRQLDICGDEPDDRRDVKPGARHDRFELTHHLDLLARNADLLLRLAQGRRDGSTIRRLDAATGKADLSGMVAQVLCALN